MTKDEALEIITASPQYREWMDALAEAKEKLSPEEWQEISQAVMTDVDAFVERHLAELSEDTEAGKTFRA